MSNKEINFTEGSIIKKLISFMIPILVSLILQAMYGAVDLLIVGRFGTTAGLSGISTGSQILNFVTFIITSFAMGVTVLISRYLGEKKPKKIGKIVGGATILFTAISVVLCINFCQTNFNTNASTKRGFGAYNTLCTDLWGRNIFYCCL
jgi:hypothetical protein